VSTDDTGFEGYQTASASSRPETNRRSPAWSTLRPLLRTEASPSRAWSRTRRLACRYHRSRRRKTGSCSSIARDSGSRSLRTLAPRGHPSWRIRKSSGALMRWTAPWPNPRGRPSQAGTSCRPTTEWFRRMRSAPCRRCGFDGRRSQGQSRGLRVAAAGRSGSHRQGGERRGRCDTI